MGRKTDRIAALEHDLDEANADYDSLAREHFEMCERVVEARRIMEAIADADFARVPPPLLDRMRAWLDFDPRPASDEGKLHWLHVKDGDRLVWRLVAELIALHDAEARRLGQPTWKHHAPRTIGSCLGEDSP